MSKFEGCCEDIKWIQLDSMVKMPCDKDLKIVVVQYKDLPDWIKENLPSNILDYGFVVAGRESHFASCPQADEFRKAKRKPRKAKRKPKNPGTEANALA